MRWKLVWKKPLLTITQVMTLAVILFGLFVALDLNRRAQEGRLVGKDEETLRAELDVELERRETLEETLVYVRSEEYVADYARNEGGYIRPGERRIVPLLIDGSAAESEAAGASADPAQYAHPWQAWWQLLTDTPMPAE